MSEARSFKGKALKATGLTVRFNLSVRREVRACRPSEADCRCRGPGISQVMSSAARAVTIGTWIVKLVTWLLGTIHPNFFCLPWAYHANQT